MTTLLNQDIVQLRQQKAPQLESMLASAGDRRYMAHQESHGERACKCLHPGLSGCHPRALLPEIIPYISHLS